MSRGLDQQEILQRKDQHEAKAASRREKQAHNLAKYAVRQAKRGNLDVLVPTKITGRFHPIPPYGNNPPNSVYARANELLADHNLKVNADIEYVGGGGLSGRYYRNTGRMTIRLVEQSSAE